MDSKLKNRLLTIANTFAAVIEDIENDEQAATTPKSAITVSIAYALPNVKSPSILNANTDDVSAAGVRSAVEMLMTSTVKDFAKHGVLVEGKVPSVLLSVTDCENRVLYRRMKTLRPKWNFSDYDLADFTTATSEMFPAKEAANAGKR